MKAIDKDDDELVFRNGWTAKDVKPYFHPWLLSEFLTIANFRNAVIRIGTWAEL